MDLHESNIGKHNNKCCTHKSPKKGRLMNAVELKAYTAAQLTNVECVGINPYKMVELHSKYYGQQIPKEYQKNILYRKPDAKVMALVKDERSERPVFRARLKESKLAGMKARLESIAYLDDSNDVVVDEKEDGDGGGEEGVREEDDNHDGPGSTTSMRETTAE
jgi:uncharacterized protein YnzC (UPF0291/DUF896 family)